MVCIHPKHAFMFPYDNLWWIFNFRFAGVAIDTLAPLLYPKLSDIRPGFTTRTCRNFDKQDDSESSWTHLRLFIHQIRLVPHFHVFCSYFYSKEEFSNNIYIKSILLLNATYAYNFIFK